MDTCPAWPLFVSTLRPRIAQIDIEEPPLLDAANEVFIPYSMVVNERLVGTLVARRWYADGMSTRIQWPCLCNVHLYYYTSNKLRINWNTT